MARDLSRPFDERKKVEKAQNEYRDRNEKYKTQFAEDFSIVGAPRGKEFEKYQLYREQQGKCVYLQEPLDIQRALFEQGYAEIDHALPYLRSFDDSKNNRVLVLSRENRNKGNKTPYEYLDGASNSERWRQFEIFVNSNKSYCPAKRNRLLKKDFGAADSEEFRERNLNDTRYICRFFKNYVEHYLQLHEDSRAKRCVVVSGQLTAFLRARWGLVKERAANDRHHALDAAVVAACSYSMVKRLSDYSRKRELKEVRTGFVDVETGEVIDPAMLQKLEMHFPNPWIHFRDELKLRLNAVDAANLRSEAEKFGTYPPEALNRLKPLFVSRAPQRRNGGALHQETIRSAKLISKGVSYVKIPLQKLKLKDLSNIVGASYSLNAPLIALLRQKLEENGDDGKKAFSKPIYKPSASGKAPIVRTVKLQTTQKNGAKLRGGIVDLGEMLRIDVYHHNNQFLCNPIYAINNRDHIKLVSLPEDADFLFSLAKNDYLRVTLKEIVFDGYFVMYESDGRVTLRAHDQPKPDKDYFRKSIANASKIEKFHVDILGRIYPASQEKRRGLA